MPEYMIPSKPSEIVRLCSKAEALEIRGWKLEFRFCMGNTGKGQRRKPANRNRGDADIIQPRRHGKEKTSNSLQSSSQQAYLTHLISQMQSGGLFLCAVYA